MIHYDLGRTYYKMTVNKKIKVIDNEIEQKIAQYNLDRQTAKASTLSSGNVCKYELLTTILAKIYETNFNAGVK